MNRSRIVSMAAVVALLAAAAWGISRLPLDWSALRHGHWQGALDTLRAAVAGGGALSYVVYLAIFTFVPLLMTPVSILCVAGGLVFPWYQAMPLIWLGCGMSAAASFWVSRTLARHWIEKWFLSRLGFLRRLDEGAHGHGFKVCLLARYLPFPYVFPGYAAGLSRIRFRDFMLGTMAGMLPWSVFYALAAHSLTQGNLKVAGLAAAGLACIVVAGVLVRRAVGLKRREAAEAAERGK